MNKAALALLVHGGTENWSPERWKDRFNEVCKNRRVLLLPNAAFDPAEIHYAAVWKPVPGELAAFPNLRVIFNLGAGVDALMADSSLPKVPLVRVAVGDLTGRMTEYVALHVLMHHRQELYLRACQHEKRWAPKSQWPASAISIGIMGLGTLGVNAAKALRHLGFRVSGWTRSHKEIDGIECFHGEAQLEPFLRRTDILVCLLPLTADTRHILNRGLFSKLNRTRRAAGGSRHPAKPRRRHPRRRIARCFRDGAFADGQPVLDASKSHPDTAQRRRYRSRRNLEICGAAD
jgi:glyoxylate/hydroxypyruvate reductase